MGSEWQTLTVDQIKAKDERSIAIGPFGSRMKADVYVASGVPVIRGNNISDTQTFTGDFVYVSEQTADELSACNVFSEDLVFPHRGAIGQVGIIPKNETPRFMLSTSLMKLACNRDVVEPLFVFYFFRSEYGRYALLQYASTVGTPGIGQPLTSLRSIRLPIPPLSEQRAIAHILGTLDDKIELNRQMNATLEEMARAVFKDWFVDSEMGEVVPASQLIEFNPSEPLSKGTPAPYLDMASLPTSGSWPDAYSIRPFSSGMRFRNGDTLLARITPCLENGKTAFIQCLPDNAMGWGSTEYIVMRPKPPVPAEFGYLLARDSAFREHAIRSMTGTSGRQRAQGEVVAAYPIAVPKDENRWYAFADFVAPLFRSIKARSEESITLAALRDTLLPKLISGELRVKDAEAMI